MKDDGTYDDKQVAKILSRAVELAGSDKDSDEPKRGTTLLDLEKIAAEAGIAPELVRAAAAEITSSGGKKNASRILLGGNVRKTMTFEVPAKASKETLERILLELPRAAKGGGSGFVSPEGLTWASAVDLKGTAGFSLSVEVRVSEHSTSVEINDDRSGTAGGLFGGFATGGGLGVGMPFTFALGPALFGPWGALLGIVPFTLFWLICRIGFGAFAKKRDTELEKLRASLKRIIERDGNAVTDVQGEGNDA